MALQIKDVENKPIKHNGEEVFEQFNTVKSVNIDRRTITIIATDESVDRQGDIILAKGWDFKNYVKNPVLLWGHNYSSVPLANAVKIIRRKTEGRPTIITHKFPSEGINPFADMLFLLAHEGVIKAGSVGFIPKEWESLDPENDEYGWRGRKYLKQELLEHSLVSVPANPNALMESIKSLSNKSALNLNHELAYNCLISRKAYDFTEEEKKRIEEVMEETKEDLVIEEEEAKVYQVTEDIKKEEEEVILDDKSLGEEEIGIREKEIERGFQFNELLNSVDTLTNDEIKILYFKIQPKVNEDMNNILCESIDTLKDLLTSYKPIVDNTEEEVIPVSEELDDSTIVEAKEDDELEVFEAILNDSNEDEVDQKQIDALYAVTKKLNDLLK